MLFIRKMDQVTRCLDCFVKDKKKVHLLCGCDDIIVKAIAFLLFQFLNQKIKLKNKTRIRRKLYRIRHYLRKIADKKVSVREKRKLLIAKRVRTTLFPFLKLTLIPIFYKSLKDE